MAMHVRPLARVTARAATAMRGLMVLSVLAAALTIAVMGGGAWAQINLPPLTGRVVDLAGVLPPDREAALVARLAAHEQATSNQLVVATVPSLQGYDIERFAVDMFRAWRLGQGDRDNGVLLLVAPTERAVRIEVGYGLEGSLTDAIGDDIIRNRILPRFRDGDLPGGIEAGTDAILATIEGAYTPTPTRQPQSDDFWPVLLFVVWFLFVLLRSRMAGRHSRIGRGYRHRRGPFIGPVGGFGGGFGGRSGGGGFSGGGGSSGGGGASGRW